MLKGTNDLWLQNNTFVAADKDNKYMKDLLKTSIIHGKQDALSIKAPILYIRNDYGQFTKQYRIELTSKLKNKETYRFSRPGDMCYPTKMAKRKNVIRTKIVDRDAEMNALIKIDNIIYMSLEFLILANACGFNFSEYTTDKDMIEGLFKVISPKHHADLLNMLSPKYFDIISNPPLWEKDDIVAGNFKLVNDDEDENKYLSLFNVIFATKANDRKKITPGSLQEEIITNLFKGKTKGNIMFDFIMSTSSNDIVPMCKRVNYDIEDSVKTFDEMRLTWFVKEEKSPDYNPNFPQALYTKQLKRGGVTEVIKGEEFMPMIGYGTNDEVSTYYKGFIWVSNRLDLVKYDKHQVHSSWQVSDVILQKTEYAKAKLQVDDDYFADNDEEEHETVKLNVSQTQPLQQFQSAEELAADFDVDD